MIKKLILQQKRIKELESSISKLKSSDIKRLEELNAQTLAIEKERNSQRAFYMEQRLKAQQAINIAQIEQIKREKELQKKLQHILKKQENARQIEQKRIAKEQDRIKRVHLENEASLQELVRISRIRQANWYPIDTRLSGQETLKEVKRLREEIAYVINSLDDQYKINLMNLRAAYEKQILFTQPDLPSKPNKKDMFETSLEYNQRINEYQAQIDDSKQKHASHIELIQNVQSVDEIQLKNKCLSQKKNLLIPYIKRLEELQNKKFTIAKDSISIFIGNPEPDQSRFPIQIIYKGKIYNIFWYYTDRKIARNLWKTKNYFKVIGIFQAECDYSLEFNLTGCFVIHLGINEKREYSLRNVIPFKEITSWKSIQQEIQITNVKEDKLRIKLKGAEIFHKFGKVYLEPMTNMEFIRVQGGCYSMGCGSWANSCASDEKPQHKVCVNSFYLGKYEITIGQWKKVMGRKPKYILDCGEDCPVVNISWNDIQEFISRLNKHSGSLIFRLSTEAEWEYACRDRGKKIIIVAVIN